MIPAETAAKKTGRPTEGKLISLRVPEDHLAAGAERAAAAGIDRSELFRRYIAAGLARDPGAPMQTWTALGWISADKRQMDIKGTSIVEAIEVNFRAIMERVAGVGPYRLTDVIVTPDRGTVGGKPCATLRVTYAPNTGLPEHDSRPERTVTVTIIGDLGTLPETHRFGINRS